MAQALPTVEFLKEHFDGLLSRDEQTRKKSEEHFNSFWVETYPHELLVCLCQILSLRETYTLDYRLLASTLFRRLSCKSYMLPNEKRRNILWLTLSDDSRTECKRILTSSLSQEQNESMRNSLCDAISELCKVTVQNKRIEDLGDIAEFLSSSMQSNEPGVNLIAFRIIGNAPKLIDQNDVGYVLNVMSSKLDSQDTDSSLVTIEAIVSVFCGSPKQVKDLMAQITEKIWGVTKGISVDEDSDKYTNAISLLINLAEGFPSLFRGIIEDVILEATRMIINPDVLDNDLKQFYVEFIVTLVENSPEMVRSSGGLYEFILSLFTLLSDLPDDDNWGEIYENGNLDDDNENYAIAEQALDRISCEFEDDYLVTIMIKLLPDLMKKQDWKWRHAGIMAISCIAEGAADYMEDKLAFFLDMVFRGCSDSHPRVRYASVHTMGQMSTDFPYTLQSCFHDQYVYHVVVLLKDFKFQRVQAHAAASIINFSQDCEAKYLLPHADALMTALLGCFLNGRTDVQEQATTSIASIASILKGDFSQYYPLTMQYFLEAIREVMKDPSKHGTYFGRFIEAVSIVVSSVDKKTSKNDIENVISIFSSIQELKNLDESVGEYLSAAWNRLCSVLGKDFSYLLPEVLPRLIADAKIDADLGIFENDERCAKGWEVYNIDDKRVGINTEVLERKADAIEMIGNYSKFIGPEFAQYANEIIGILIPLLGFEFNDRVRLSSASALPNLLKCLKSASEVDDKYRNMYLDIWNNSLSPKLLDVLGSDMDLDTVDSYISSVASFIELFGTELVTDGFLNPLIGSFVYYLDKTRKHVESLDDDGQGDDTEDDEDPYDMLECYESIVMSISKCLHLLLKSRGSTVLPMLEHKIMPYYEHFLSYKGNDLSVMLCEAVGFFVNVVEFTDEHSAKCSGLFERAIRENLNNEDPEILQTVVYGIGISTRFGNDVYYGLCHDSFPVLVVIIKLDRSIVKNRKYSSVIENALSSIAKIAFRFGDRIDVGSVVPDWIAALPATEDEEEFKTIYSFLAFLIEKSHPYVMSSYILLMDKILDSILTVRSQKHQAQYEMLFSVTKMHIIPKINEQEMHQLWNVLDERQKAVMNELSGMDRH